MGIYAVAVAIALGSEDVAYVDRNRSRLEVAEQLGARVIEGNPKALHKEHSLAERFPLSVDANGTLAGLHLALSSLSACGSCSIVAFHWRNGTPLPLWDMYARNINVITVLVDSRSMLPHVLSLSQSARFNPRAVVSSVGAWDDAPEALLEASTKVIIERPRMAP